MRLQKIWLIGLLLALLALSACGETEDEPVVEGAVDSGFCGDNLTWAITEDDNSGSTVLTISGTGEMYDWKTIDSTDNVDTPWAGYGFEKVVIEEGVTSIGALAFHCCALTDLTLSDTVASIGYNAFSYCDLKELTLGSAVQTIGMYAFQGCPQLTSVTVNGNHTVIEDSAFRECKSLTCVILDGVVSIGESAFSNCSQLARVAVSGDNVSIGASAFAECGELSQVALDGVAAIGSEALLFCEQLTEIAIPASVTSIGEACFARCGGLTEFAVDENNPSYTAIDGVLFTKDGSTLLQYPIGRPDTSYTVPEGTVTIGARAFQFCLNIEEVTLPEGVTTIEEEAFFYCPLTTLTLPGSVTSFGKSAFGLAGDLSQVYYGGSEADWLALQIGDGNDILNQAILYFADEE